MLCLKIAGLVANSVDPDDAVFCEVSSGSTLLLRPVFRNTYSKCCIDIFSYFSTKTYVVVLISLAKALLMTNDLQHNVLWRNKKKNINP